MREGRISTWSSSVLIVGLTALLLASGCSGCETDPCEDVICPEGEICVDGECVPNIDGPDGPCRRDTDCAEVQGRTRCDAVTGKCVECIIAAHCPNPERQICDPVDKFCVPRPPCEADADCVDLPGTPRCNTVSGSCVTCLTDAHCSGRQQGCDVSTGTCRFQPCEIDADCAEYPEAPHCRTSNGLCQECTNDGHCPEGTFCRDGVCRVLGECQSDSDCGVAQRCNPLTQTCVQCVSSVDCRLGGRCISYHCRSGLWCEIDADCGSPLRCSVQTSTCFECVENSHCASGQVCEGGSCLGGQSCGPGVFCGPGEECLSGSCSPYQCADDGTGAGPLPYQAAAREPGSVEFISLCPNTWRWFVYDADLGDGLIVDLSYQVVTDHPTLLVWAGTGTGAAIVGEPSVTATGQRLEVSLLSRPGPIWIGIRGVNEHLTASMDVEVVSGGLCADDSYEPNDSPDLAVRLPDPVSGTTSVEAIACFGNEDWFRLPVPTGLRTIAEATMTDGGSNPLVVSLHVRGAGGNMQLIGGSGTNLAEASARASATDVFVRISNTTLGGRPYRLEVRLRPPRPSNDQCSGATTLFPSVPIQGTTAGAADTTSSLCGGAGSPDVVYTFTLEERAKATIRTEGALDTVLSLRSICDEPSSELACSDVQGDVEELTGVLPAGDWHVWVDGHDGREGGFTIRLELEDAPPPPVNDSCDLPLVLNAIEGGGIESGELASAEDLVTASCGDPGGDAVYSISLDEPVYLFAELEALEGMSLSLRGDCEDDESELICSAVEDGSSALLEIPFLQAGEYFLVVDGGGITGGEFDLVWALGSPIPPPLNDSCETPWPLDFTDDLVEIAGETGGASDAHDAVCAVQGFSGPDVVYRFMLTEPSALEAILDAGFDGVLDLRGGDCESPASSLACSDSRPARVFHPELPAGIYHLIVDGYAGERGPFLLSVERGTPLPVPANDKCEDAALIDVSSGMVIEDGYTWRAGNDLDPGPECTGSTTSGPDVAYAVDLLAGETLGATVSPEPGFDPAIYVLDDCDVLVCLAGADESFVSQPESVTFTAQEDGRYFVIIDAWRAGEAGQFQLTLSVE